MDLARSVQDVTEEVMLRMARHIHKEPDRNTFVWRGG
jgi:predicted NodU family carbamoyl transferase